MKIIGTSIDTVIIEAKKDEIANLLGYYSKHNDGFKINVGDEIQISKMYRQLYHLAHHEKDIKKVIEDLLDICKNLELVVPVISKISEESY